MPNKSKLALTAVLVVGAAAVLLAQPAGPDARDANSRSAKAAKVDGDRPGLPISEQEEGAFLRVLDEKRPEEAKALRKLKEDSPREYRLAMMEAYRAYLVWKDMPPEMQKAHEAQARAKVEAWRVSRLYLAASDPAQKERLHSRLLDLLGQEFDADQTIREHRLGQMEEQIKRLRAELRERAGRRTQVIDQVLADLLSAKVRPGPGAEPRRPLTMPAASRPAK